MAEVATFSSSGADAITRTIELEETIPSILSEEELEDTFDIERTVQEIEKGEFNRIALQFPDELLPHSVPIFKTLKSRVAPHRELYVLADTTYGSCCVDEVAAQHVDADALVHYGHACMSQPSRLPVIYVLGRKPMDPSHCANSFSERLKSLQASEKSTVLFRYDVAYAHKADEVISQLKQRLPSSRILHTPISLIAHPAAERQQSASPPLDTTPDTPSVGPSENTLQGCASPEDTVILYIGGECLTLTNLLLTHASYEVFSYDPTTRDTRLESGRTNKLLMRRYGAVQKARDADVIGILVGTLGVANYLPLIAHLRSIIKKAHKKSYTITVGKPNPAKLGNFMEVECFVLVACPENSLLDAKEFLQPIVTPYELEVALQPTQTWTGRYVLDFGQLLREHEEGLENSGTREEDEPEDLDEPVFSMITGKYRHAKRYGDESATSGDAGSSAVILRNQEGTLSKMDDSAAAQFLQTRTFRGLETRVGEDAPSLLEQGRSGIARGYTDDRRDESQKSS